MKNLKTPLMVFVLSCLMVVVSFFTSADSSLAASNRCYWMENYSGNFNWVDSPQGNVSKDECYALDSCDGGLGQSGGGCYKWASSPTAERQPWESCYWMENYSGNFNWVDAPQGDVSENKCYTLDSCDGGLGESGGGCYKWSIGPKGDRTPWTPACYWMENYSGNFNWVDAPQGNVSKKECFALDSCDGGLGESGGGCYKWALGAKNDRLPWD